MNDYTLIQPVSFWKYDSGNGGNPDRFFSKPARLPAKPSFGDRVDGLLVQRVEMLSGGFEIQVWLDAATFRAEKDYREMCEALAVCSWTECKKDGAPLP